MWWRRKQGRKNSFRRPQSRGLLFLSIDIHNIVESNQKIGAERVMSTSISKASMNELDAVAELFDLYRVFYEQPSDLIGAKEFLKERLENEESVIYLALHEGEAVGFTQLYPTFSSVSMKRSWVLNDLYVRKSARGKGIAQKLIEQAFSLARETKAKGVLLETGKDNEAAQRLYEKIGFVKERNFFYYYSV
jgi:ribosomal protein S18 acetylase RimI-like enzyme